MSNEIKIAGDSFAGDKIISANAYMFQSIDGSELQYDTLDANLELGSLAMTKFVPKGSSGMLTADKKIYMVLPLVNALTGDPGKYKYGSLVQMFHNEKLVGKFYMDSMERVGKTKYRISCVSAIGLLDKSKHYGGIYKNVTVPDLLREIIGDNIAYSIAPEYEKILVYGWLPFATRRENLHQLLFAIGASVGVDKNGDPVFQPYNTEAITKIPDSRIYANGSVKYPYEATGVSIYEHSYQTSKNIEPNDIFEGQIAESKIKTPNGETVNGDIIIFDGPYDPESLTATGTQIKERGVNYAVLAPSINAKLSGRPYRHSMRQINRPELGAEKALTSTSENNVSVENATLVSFANAENIADRIYSYYNASKTVNADIVLDKERVGDFVKFNDAFGEETIGVIKSMGMNFSGVVKAGTEVISDYKPLGPGNYYTHVKTITDTGSWIVPDDTKKIRVVLIGGGSGGYSGCAGKPSKKGARESGPAGGFMEGAYVQTLCGEGGEGGEGGAGGEGGKILIATLNVSPGESISIKIGAGGHGGVYSPDKSMPGAAGGDTTLGTLTSAKGERTPSGYFDSINSAFYGEIGKAGINGGKGSSYKEGFEQGIPNYNPGNPVSLPDGRTWNPGDSPQKCVKSKTYIPFPNSGSLHLNSLATSGLGGGAAIGSNGHIGTNGYTFATAEKTTAGATPGVGGAGASALINGDVATSPGQGGGGGNGGGGGGGGGYAVASYTKEVKKLPNGNLKVDYGTSSAGGDGSNGGDGAPGCVIIYY